MSMTYVKKDIGTWLMWAKMLFFTLYCHPSFTLSFSAVQSLVLLHTQHSLFCSFNLLLLPSLSQPFSLLPFSLREGNIFWWSPTVAYTFMWWLDFRDVQRKKKTFLCALCKECNMLAPQERSKRTQGWVFVCMLSAARECVEKAYAGFVFLM